MSENTEKIGGVVPDIRTESGSVLEISGSTETRVSGSIYSERSSFTGKYVGTTGSIGSTTVDHQKIWLELPDGSERWYQWTGREVPLRKGHKVSAVMVTDGRSHYTVAVVNHTTREYFLTYTAPDPILKHIGANAGSTPLAVGLVAGLVTFLIAYPMVEDRGFLRYVGLALGGLFAFGFGLGGLLLALVSGQSDRRKQLEALLNQHCGEVLRKGFPDSASQGDSKQEIAG